MPPKFPTFSGSGFVVDTAGTAPGFSEAIAHARVARLGDELIESGISARADSSATVEPMRTPFTDRLASLTMTNDRPVEIESPLPARNANHAVEVLHPPVQLPVAPVEEDDEFVELMEHLAMRDIARERLRARLLAMHSSTKQRSTYEIVFLMLAGAMTILVTAPPLVDVLLALHGSR